MFIYNNNTQTSWRCLIISSIVNYVNGMLIMSKMCVINHIKEIGEVFNTV